KESAEIYKEFLAAKAARDKLATAADEEASYKWGRFLAYCKGQWGDGLPLLAAGNEEKVQMLAEKDQTNPKHSAEQTETGDGWYALGEAEKSALAKKNLWLRAKYWYEQAQPMLAGFNKSKVDKRLKDIDALLPKEEPGTTGTASTTMPKTTPAKNDFD